MTKNEPWILNLDLFFEKSDIETMTKYLWINLKKTKKKKSAELVIYVFVIRDIVADSSCFH